MNAVQKALLRGFCNIGQESAEHVQGGGLISGFRLERIVAAPWVKTSAMADAAYTRLVDRFHDE